ncbi:MAG: 2,3-bisphosphoglycerate-independent phosphoglycerate mutase, partial [Calditrichaeota bacterium]|nr:2,3-bisphosphoglycerate-independent phosphoglycerate mutase [Calditrichota bacterium]
MKKAILVILDGFGCRKELDGNAIRSARKPFFDQLINDYPYTLIETSGEAVGLVSGQMGNSEVGHMNIGSGRIIYQDSMRIHKSIESGDFFNNRVLLDAMATVNQKQSALHLIGLLSDGGVHSHQNHLYALLKMAADQHCKTVYIHIFTDGRDTAPNSGLTFVKKLQGEIDKIGVGKIASVSGRYYAMDRNKRWDRIEAAYLAMNGESKLIYADAISGIEAAYKKQEFDEFIVPFCVAPSASETVRIANDDLIIAFNYRSDRMRQLSRSLADPQFNQFIQINGAHNFVQFTEYDAAFPLPTVFPAQEIRMTIGEVISRLNLKQLRAAETEKYAHVTFFLNGGVETVFAGEDRIMVESPKVATYDLQPEMSAYQLTDKLVDAIRSDSYQFIVCNYANSDMVGHTGVFNAAVSAIETLDSCLQKLVTAAKTHDFTVLITADHGNAEQMIDPLSGMAFTQHTTGPVPLIVVDDSVNKLTDGGRLCDVAPTVLELM